MFFEKLFHALGDDPVIITVQKKEDKLFVSVVPKMDKDKKLAPITASGTPQQLDTGLADAIANSFQLTSGFFVNTKAFEESAKKMEEEAKAKKAEKDKKENKDSKESPKTPEKKEKKKTPAEQASEMLLLAKDSFKDENYELALEQFENAKKLNSKLDVGNNIMQCKIKIKAAKEFAEEKPSPEVVTEAITNVANVISEPAEDSLAQSNDDDWSETTEVQTSTSPEHGEAEPEASEDSGWGDEWD